MHGFPLLTHAIFHLLHLYGLLALFVLLVIEEAGIPIPAPGDTLIVVAGAQPGRTALSTVAVLATCTAAVFIGSSILYVVMRRGGRPMLAKYGKLLHLTPQRLERTERWFARHGPLAIVVGRLIPGLRVPTTVMAGLSGVPYRIYAPSAVVAALIWSSFYFWIGALLHRHLGILTTFGAGLLDGIEDSALVLAAIVVPLVLVLAAWYARRRIARRGIAASLKAAEDESSERPEA